LPQKIDHVTWMEQPLIWAERCRGRSLAWTPDASWFVNDPLGPVPHSHDDATEIALLAQGQMEILVGGTKRVYGPGDLIIMPPDKFHNYWFKGDDTVCLFVVVAPNHKYARFRTQDYRPGAFEGDAQFASVFGSDPLPSNQHFATERLILPPGATTSETMFKLKDTVIYVLSGTALLRMNTLVGPLAAHQYQHIPATVRFQISNPGYEPLVYLNLTITDPFTEHGTELVKSGETQAQEQSHK
jgi:mannose-6-phosphate isomerase-like protein (cupin superfamily)